MESRFLKNVYKYLPIIFGCHCRDDRSFHYKGIKFPICSRCTGELVGIIFGAVLCFFYIPKWWLCILIGLPMIVDGFVQLLTRYESNNTKRFVTGALFGYAVVCLFVISTIVSFKFGIRLSHLIQGR